MDLKPFLPSLLLAAWLAPLVSFAVIVFFGPRMGRGGRGAGYVATAAIGLSLVLSLFALAGWLGQHPLSAAQPPEPLSGDWYILARFGSLRLTVGYYIDALTVAMFVVVSLVAGCIHVYSFGYMGEELGLLTDPLVRLSDGRLLRRRGRFARFFQYLSLFSFSMLGLVVAGNAAMVFVFWELVGICSYLLIGFYHERRSASNAANKAFIVNRVGDFGMVVGLMGVLAGFGTFAFGDLKGPQGEVLQRGIFSQVRPPQAHAPLVPDGMVRRAARAQIEAVYRASPDPAAAEAELSGRLPRWRQEGVGYGLLVLAGLGIFCGCVGKSAQFPLHVWLPDAMEGPTPVSALIHAATMVAAGVYLVGRFYPLFTPEVLLAIAGIGCVTLLLAASMALVATDIKRVLAYSTVSQLGYMMLALGTGAWLAGLFHLVTHAFFKALLFLGAGSVIHACRTNEMPQMGGLLRKMPWTAWTMLAGCLAICGAGLPLGATGIGLSGYYSKDAILAQVFCFGQQNPPYRWLYGAAVLGAVMTAYYMFRLWFLTFPGQPRDRHLYEHAHESPKVMVVPLVVLAVFVVVGGWNVPASGLGVEAVLQQARPAGTGEGIPPGRWLPELAVPAEHDSHAPEVHHPVAWTAFGAGLLGFLLAAAVYWWRLADPAALARAFGPVYGLLRRKWWFDELYEWLLVRPVLRLGAWAAVIDRRGIDWIADNLPRSVRLLSALDDWIDRTFVDAVVDRVAGLTYAVGLRLRAVQTGQIRQYVMLVAVGTVLLFVIISFFRLYALGA
ncbi:MAG: NADH-quinone oxidoreductase subunit L [Thermoguttaceae bacterium]